MNALLAFRQKLQKGNAIHHEGKTYTMYDFDSRPSAMYVRVIVDGKHKRWAWKKFLAKLNQTTEYAGEISSFEDDLTPLLGLLPDEERARVVLRIRDLLELRHGDPFGTFAGPRPGHKPSDRYNQTLVPVLHDRLKLKSEDLTLRGETGVGTTTLREEYNALFKEGGAGVVGLIRAKYVKRLSPILDLPDDVKVIARRVAVGLAERVNGTVSIKDQTADTVVELADAGYHGIPKAKLRQLIDVASVGLNLRRTGKQRQSMNSRPREGVQGSHRALYPGHIVQLDTTPINLICRTADGKLRRYLDVLTAIDVYSRMVLAVRVVEKPHTAVDVNLLLHDMLGGDFRRATWKTGSDHLWIGLPSEIHVPNDGSVIFGMKVKSVIFDLGSQYNNTTTLAVLAMAGIRVFFTPPRKGSAKGIVESFQKRYADLTGALDGDKGRSPEHRGADSKTRRLPMLEDVERLLWDFISEVYNFGRHRNLLDPEAAKRKISPVDMIVQYMHEFGSVVIPRRASFRLAFLKEEKRFLHPEGIWLDDVRFDSDELATLRPRADNAPELMIRHDPRVPTYIHVWHETRHVWIFVPDYESHKGYVKVNKETLRRGVRDGEVPRFVHSEAEGIRALGRVRQRFQGRVKARHDDELAAIAAERRAASRQPVVTVSETAAGLAREPASLFVDVPDVAHDARGRDAALEGENR
ncbi:MAG: transposase [Cellulomonadaceae bacterium]|nr:transposase [Cellulomonadaceae bacterium]